MITTHFLIYLFAICVEIGKSAIFCSLSSMIASSAYFTSSRSEEQSIDTSLYSRQLFVYGKSAQMKLLEGKVLLVAEDELLSFEVAKNLALTGVGKIALYSMNALHSSKKLRISGDDGSLSEYISALNPYVKVQNISFSTSVAYASLPNDLHDALIVICSNNFTTINQWNQFARRNNARTVAIYQHGKIGFVFDDFLDDFEVLDVEGEVFKEILLSNSVKELSGHCLEIRSIDEEVLGYGLGDHIHLAAATSSPNSANNLKVEFIVKEVVNMQTCIIQPVLPHTGDIQPVITLIASNNAIAQKLKSQTRVHHTSFAMQLLNPSFTPGNGCLSPKLDRATNLILLALLKVDFVLSNTNISKVDYERQLNASLAMELRLLTNNSDVFTPTKSKSGKMSVNLIHSIFTSFVLYSQNNAQIRVVKQCPALVSTLGAIGAQEAIKGLIQLYRPVDQFLMVEGLDTIHPLPLSPTAPIAAALASNAAEEEDETETDGRAKPKQQQQEKQSIEQELAGLKVFVVGAGAIGCELLKTFALLGVGTGNSNIPTQQSSLHSTSLWHQYGLDNGGIIVTDMDHIERSNLNRQLLFRPRHIGFPKSTIAAEQVKKINPNVKILALTSRVGRQEGEEKQVVFDEAFWQEIDIVVTALDNVEARLFIDEQCIKHKLWLIDSGTLGTKGNTQVIIPYLSESYASSADPPEVQLPLCTVKSFPYQPEHCVAWAKELFAASFGTDIGNLEQFIFANTNSTNKNELTDEDEQRLQENIATLEQPIIWAKNLFVELFQKNVQDLLKQHPKDSFDEDDLSKPFWSGSRRVPSAIVCDDNDELHVEFVASAVYVRLRALGQLPVNWTLETVKDKIRNNEDIILKSQDRKALQFQPQSFEKDELSLGHVHFVTSAANLRSRVYNLKEVDLLTVQGLAGKIIPALATTTALVSGLVSLEVIKVASERILLRSGQNAGYYHDRLTNNQSNTCNSTEIETGKVSSIGRRIISQLFRKKTKQENQGKTHQLLSHTHPRQRLQLDEERLFKRFRNSFVNLAVPLLSFAQPVSADTLSLHSATNQKFNLWHEINLELSSTDTMIVDDLLQMLKDEYQVEVTAMMAEESMLYASFLPDADEIRVKTVRELLEPLLPQLTKDEDAEEEEEANEETIAGPSRRTQVIRLELSCHKASSVAVNNDETEQDEAKSTDAEEIRLPPLVIRIQPLSYSAVQNADEDSATHDDDSESDDENRRSSVFQRGWIKVKEAIKLILEK